MTEIFQVAVGKHAVGAIRLELGFQLRHVDSSDHRALPRELPCQVGHDLSPTIGARQ